MTAPSEWFDNTKAALVAWHEAIVRHASPKKRSDQIRKVQDLSYAGNDLMAILELILHRGPTTVRPVPILFWCPACGERHIDQGEFATRPHHTHSCQQCGLTWRPAVIETVGVHFLPGFKDAEKQK